MKSGLFQASIRNCLNCVYKCDDHSLLEESIPKPNGLQCQAYYYFLLWTADYLVCLVLAEFSRHNPELFARFIPNLLPPTHWDQLPTLIQEDRMLQENLVTSQGFTR